MSTDKTTPLRQLQAYAHIDGAKMALLWTASFACFILEFSYPLLGMVWLLSLCLVPVAACLFLKAFKANQPDGTISFGRGWAYVAYTFFYATLLFALAQFVYFQFIDNGFLVNQYTTILSDPAYMQLFKAYGYSETDIATTIKTMRELSSIEISMNFASVNLIAGLVIGVPVAAIFCGGKRQ